MSEMCHIQHNEVLSKKSFTDQNNSQGSSRFTPHTKVLVVFSPLHIPNGRFLSAATAASEYDRSNALYTPMAFGNVKKKREEKEEKP